MLYEAIIFLFGLCVGSFLNVVIWRLEKGESVILGVPSENCSRTRSRTVLGRMSRSHCPYCKTILRWHDLMPVFSFLFLRGQCRYCGGKISWQYPIVEIATGILFVLIFGHVFNFVGVYTELVPFNILNLFRISNFEFRIFALCYMLYVACSMIVIFVYDLKHYIIPDKILFPAIGVALFYRVSEFFLAFDFAALRSGNKILFSELARLAESFGEAQVKGLSLVSPYFIAAIFTSAFFLSLVLISKGKWMGLGDVKLAFLMGLILGWPNILVALFLAFFLGALTGLALIFSNSMFSREQFSGKPENCSRERYYTLKSQVPFGPFLIIGTFAALFWGGRIVEWYMRLLLF